MTEIEKKANMLIMEEIGLEIRKGQRIYDQDTGLPVKINGMDIVAPGCLTGRKSVEFDPYNNRKMMGQLFGYFMDKQSDETGVEVTTYYNVDDRVECRMSDNEVIKSSSYKKDSLKYLDIIMQINGGKQDLSIYDIKDEKPTVKKKKGSK